MSSGSCGSSKRPEGSKPPEMFYDDREARKYDASSRMINIQNQITQRALQMLALPPGKSCYLLDVGCGSGLSGQVLQDAGHYWVGCDISSSMLHVAAERRKISDQSDECGSDDESPQSVSAAKGFEAVFDDEEYDDEDSDEEAQSPPSDGEDDNGSVDAEDDIDASAVDGVTSGDSAIQEGQGDLLRVDIGQGLPFQPGTFDGVISISALQWLCYANSSEQNPVARLNRFFSSLYMVMKKSAKAVLQFYPENSEQAVLIAQSASKVGFAGGVVVDYPNSSKAKKYYLCLSFERSFKVPTALGPGGAAIDSAHAVDMIARDSSRQQNAKRSARQQRKGVKSKGVDWIMRKKEKQRKLGKTVKADSKYTGRKRSTPF